MRIREDSPFYGITEEQKEMFLDEAEQLSHMRIAELWEMRSGKTTSEGQVKRFLQRLRYERAIRDTDDSPEDLGAFAGRAKDGKARDGLIEAARQKLFEQALANGNSEMLLELYRAANDERAREREVAVAQKKAAVAEENARIALLRLDARGLGGERRVLKADVTSSAALVEVGPAEPLLLPKVREALTDTTKPAEERIAAALQCLGRESGTEHVKLLGNGGVAAVAGGSAMVEKAIEGEPKVAQPPTIDWEAPWKKLIAEGGIGGMIERGEL